MNQLDMFSHQAELPMSMPAPLPAALAPAAKQVDRAIPVLRRPEVMYRHPGEMALAWTGRGKPPRWVTEWVQSGKSLEALRVNGAAHG